MQTGWVFTSLGPFREGEGTYSLYPADSLPPLPTGLFGQDFAWIPPGPHDDVEYMEPIDVDAQTLSVDGLPKSFTTFMSRPDHLAAIPSNTACYWQVSPPGPAGDGARLMLFLVDQQSCVFWYLYLRADGTHAVVASGSPQPQAADLLLVSDDFEAFIYRFWVENLAWFEVVDQEREWTDLSLPVAEYLDPYRAIAGIE
jgi:hypothetical protein